MFYNIRYIKRNARTKKKKYKLKSSMPIILEVVFGIHVMPIVKSKFIYSYFIRHAFNG